MRSISLVVELVHLFVWFSCFFFRSFFFIRNFAKSLKAVKEEL